MKAKWPTEKFGEFLRPNSRPYTLGQAEDANLVGMRLYGNGPFHRELKPAMQIAKKSHFVIRAGDVIYNKLFAWKGTFGIVPPALHGMFVSDKFPTYELDRSKVDEKWLRWYFRYPLLWDEAQTMSTGSAALSKLTLNPPKFLLLTMPMPPLAEQRRIVARIEQVAAQVNEARALRQKATEEAEALYSSALTQLIGRSGASDARLEEICLQVTDGEHATPFRISERVTPLVTAKNVRAGFMDLTYTDFVSEDTAEKCWRRCKPQNDDVLMVCVGATTGRVCRLTNPPPMVIVRSVALIRPNPSKLDPKFLEYALEATDCQSQVWNKVKQAAQPCLYIHRIKDLQIPLPSLSEQWRIIAYLDDLREKTDVLNALQSETSAELDALMPSILDKAFRGEL